MKSIKVKKQYYNLYNFSISEDIIKVFLVESIYWIKKKDFNL